MDTMTGQQADAGIIDPNYQKLLLCVYMTGTDKRLFPSLSTSVPFKSSPSSNMVRM